MSLPNRPPSQPSGPGPVKVAKLRDIEEGGSKIVEVEGRKIALFKTGGSVYAIDNTCPHAGGPLGEGHLEGNFVTCPWHGWRFDVSTGECKEVPQDRLTPYKVEIQGEDVILGV